MDTTKTPKSRYRSQNGAEDREDFESSRIRGQLDDFELSMNRAAEKAAPEAKGLFLDAIKQMTFTDAKKILNGRENEATLYFKDKTSPRLKEMSKPIVHQAMADVGVTRSYQDLEQSARSVPFPGTFALTSISA